MKPRVMSLVLFTCMVGMLVAPNKISFASLLISLFAVALGAGKVLADPKLLRKVTI